MASPITEKGERVMAKLNLNFHQQTGRYELSKNEIYQIEGIALSIEAILKTLGAYANEGTDDIGSVCQSVCSALEILIDPVVEYLGNYAGSEPAPEKSA
jgi:hypothetical protein